MNTLLIIDTSALIHRAFHALPPLTTPRGEPSGAVFGFIKILMKSVEEHRPTHIMAALDRPEKTFRKELFEDYKAHRPPTPEVLIAQIIKLPEILSLFNIPLFEQKGYEADDIIGTAVEKLKHEKDLNIIILTGDLDALQLVEGDRVVVATPQKGTSGTILYNEKAVRDRFLLAPHELPDYKGLVGDSSDNIPGVMGIGPKTATAILTKYHSLENAFQEKNINDPLIQKIIPHKKDALFSKHLATIKRDVPFSLIFPSLLYTPQKNTALAPFFEQWGFKTLLKKEEIVPHQASLT